MNDAVSTYDEAGRLVEQRMGSLSRAVQVVNESAQAKGAVALYVYGVLYLDKPVSAKELEKAMMERVVSKLFRMRAVERVRDGVPVYEGVAAEDMDMSYHFADVGAIVDEDLWCRTLVKWTMTPLDSDKPKWRAFSVPKLPCGRAAAVLVIDHTIADGVALSAMTRELLCEGYKGIPISSGAGADRPPPLQPSWAASAWQLVKATLFPLVEPVLPGDKPNALKIAHRAQPKDFDMATTEGFDLERFKAIKNKIPGATVNDTLMAVTAMALGKYYRAVDDKAMQRGDQISASFLMEVRPQGADVTSDNYFGNDWVTCTCAYPMQDAPIDTIVKIRNSTGVLKLKPPTAVRFAITKYGLPLAPRSILPGVMLDINAKVTFTTSNVFLSHEQMTLAGVPILDMDFGTLPPLGLYVGVGTYLGRIKFNILTAKETGATAADIASHFNKALEELEEVVASASLDEIRAAERRHLARIPLLPVLLIGAAAVALGAVVAFRDTL